MTLTKPSELENQFSSLYQRMSMSLEEMTRSFVNYKLGLDKTEYLNDKKAFTSTQADIFELEQKLIALAHTAQTQLETYNTDINRLNKANSSLLNRVNNFDNEALAAQGELKLQNVLYEELYIQNIILSIFALISIVILIKNRSKT